MLLPDKQKDRGTCLPETALSIFCLFICYGEAGRDIYPQEIFERRRQQG